MIRSHLLWNDSIVKMENSSTLPISDGYEIGAEMIILTTMLFMFCVLGVVGNAIAFYIYFGKRDKSTSTIFILSLAVTDFLTCLIVVPYTIAAELLQYRLVFDIVCKFYLFLITSNVPLSAFIMVAIGFDRYFCICHPFLHILTVPIAKICVMLLTTFAFLLGIITSLTYGVYLDSSRLLPVLEPELDHDNLTEAMLGDYYYINLSTKDEKPINFTYYGTCVPNEVIISEVASNVYQKVYAALFLVSFIIVAFLYALIYKSILQRRAWRNRCKRASCYTSVTCHDLGMEETQLTATNGIVPPLIGATMGKGPIRAAAALREKMMYANIKTAAMLFVVTLVFIISYLPSWLMGLELIPFNIIVYQFYFLNNVVNPFIYAFMNRTFRDDLKNLLKKC